MSYERELRARTSPPSIAAGDSKDSDELRNLRPTNRITHAPSAVRFLLLLLLFFFFFFHSASRRISSR